MATTDRFPRGHAAAPLKNAKLATSQWVEGGKAWNEGDIWLGRNGDDQAIGHADDRHMVTVAGSRAGKGRSGIIPNLILWPASCVVMDPKGENATVTADVRARRPGHLVRVLDPLEVAQLDDPALRTTFNPFDLIDARRDDAIDLAAAIGDALMVAGDDRDVHWTESARQIIEGLILHVAANKREKNRSLGRVRQLLIVGDEESAAFFTEMNRDQAASEARAKAIDAGKSDEDAEKVAGEAAAAVKETSPFAALWSRMASNKAENEAVRDVIAGAAQSIRDMGENERGSVLSNARRNTKFIDSPWMQRCLASSGFKIDELKQHAGGVSLYVCLPARFIPTHARFLRLVLNLILYQMEVLGTGPTASNRPVLFVLDEFAALGRLEAIEKAAGLMAGYGVKLWPILQDLGQVKRHYKESWETFLGNAGVLQFFANTDLTTLEWLSKRIGQVEVIRETVTKSVSDAKGTNRSRSQSNSSSWNVGNSTNDGTSQMAGLQQIQAREGGSGLVGWLSRGEASPISLSQGKTEQQGQGGGTALQEGVGASSTRSGSKGRNEGIHLAPLMTLDEIGRHFDRAGGLQMVLIDGAPVALRRTPYDLDPQFEGQYRA